MPITKIRGLSFEDYSHQGHQLSGPTKAKPKKKSKPKAKKR